MKKFLLNAAIFESRLFIDLAREAPCRSEVNEDWLALVLRLLEGSVRERLPLQTIDSRRDQRERKRRRDGRRSDDISPPTCRPGPSIQPPIARINKPTSNRAT